MDHLSSDAMTGARSALRVLGVRGYADAGVVAELTGTPETDAAEHLERCAHDGLVAFRERRRSWSLTPEGRAALEEALAAERVAAGVEAGLVRCYERFLALNGPFKQLCTDWQIGGQAPHHVDALAALHAGIEPALSDLASASPWFAHYATRLGDAFIRLRSGDPDAFTKPLTNSYHDVWMELHQDLLLALGRTRSTEDGT